MDISDLFLLISILFAILTFMSPEDRGFIKNKFTFSNFIFLTAIFLLLHYLIFFEEYFLIRFNFLKIFLMPGLPTAKTWAYMISLFSIIWILYKVFNANFPKKNQEGLKKYYRDLYNKEKYERILDNIEKFNKNEVIEFFNGNISPFNSFLFEDIICDYIFLQETASYNISLIKLCTDNCVDNNNKMFFKIYLTSQINTQKSYLNKKLDISNIVIEQNKETNKNIDLIFNCFNALDKGDLERIIEYNLKNNIITIDALIEITYLIANKHVEIFNEKESIITINRLFFNKCICSEPNVINDLFNLILELLFVDKIKINFFERLFESSIILLRDIINKKIELSDYLITKFIESSLILYKNTDFQNQVEKLLIKVTKDESYKEFRKSLYRLYMLSYNEKNENFKEKVILEIANN